MAIDADQIVVAGNGKIYVAPVGSTQPTDVSTAWDAAWIDLGYATEDGVTITKGRDTEDIDVWQSFLPVRKVVTGETLEVSFSLVQWNADTVKLAFGGGSVAVAGGVSTYTPPAPGTIDERAVGIEWVDGDRIHRLVIDRAMVTEAVETTLSSSSAAELPITMAAVAPPGGGLGYKLLFEQAA